MVESRLDKRDIRDAIVEALREVGVGGGSDGDDESSDDCPRRRIGGVWIRYVFVAFVCAVSGGVFAREVAGNLAGGSLAIAVFAFFVALYELAVVVRLIGSTSGE